MPIPHHSSWKCLRPIRVLYNNRARREWDAKITSRTRAGHTATQQQQLEQNAKQKQSNNRKSDAVWMRVFPLELDPKQKQNDRSARIAVCLCVDDWVCFGHFCVCCKKSRITLKWIEHALDAVLLQIITTIYGVLPTRVETRPNVSTVRKKIDVNYQRADTHTIATTITTKECARIPISDAMAGNVPSIRECY